VFVGFQRQKGWQVAGHDLTREEFACKSNAIAGEGNVAQSRP
jgi:hypothetical protein